MIVEPLCCKKSKKPFNKSISNHCAKCVSIFNTFSMTKTFSINSRFGQINGFCRLHCALLSKSNTFFFTWTINRHVSIALNQFLTLLSTSLFGD
ncbi:uncharacterized protein ASCRUDRAFT_148899 [Ascoidea rubescens DSM 1968]|uniref:Uncharacterized protein n=1 Tax=Ascoidea rubescens DSM 1968 TaxID=1344418 RepID=A0A1D2VGB2_9ASCO|nr:hypothetical protein ASCRUDRAFT_148899 [Ascoidea rubescens DSM 1968]ODV60639.1 hypothetical protein ASCRUDRAFT_148899 [Ascoidea rubescens DSM 1968]